MMTNLGQPGPSLPASEGARPQTRVAAVTGAARGIGLAIAERLGADGDHVVLVDIDGDALQQVANRLSATGTNCVTSIGDIANQRDAARMVEAAAELGGGVDILVNNAGITGPAKPLWEYDLEEWETVLAVNLTGTFLACRAVLPGMIERGYGRIVNVASVSGKEGNPNMAAYSASKAAMLGLTKALAKEVARTGVYVNAVTPAVIETEILQQLTPEAVRYMVDRIPMGRTGRPQEVAALVRWLCSDECSFSTGAVFDISGGRATY